MARSGHAATLLPNRKVLIVGAGSGTKRVRMLEYI
jgi:hypothetical protein